MKDFNFWDVARNTWQAYFGVHTVKVLFLDRSFKMSLFKYFWTKSLLPKPDGPLSMIVLSLSAVAANKKVKKLLDMPKGKDTRTSKRGMYESFTSEEKAWMGKRVTEYSVTVRVCHLLVLLCLYNQNVP